MSQTLTYEEWRRRKSCTEKKPYDSIIDANWQVLRHWKGGQWAETYMCAYCGCFHVTTSSSELDAPD